MAMTDGTALDRLARRRRRRVARILVLRPKGGPNYKFRLERADELVGYSDHTVFPLARMVGIHDMEETPDGFRLTHDLPPQS